MLRPTSTCSAACCACSATSGHKQPTSAENANPRRTPPGGLFAPGGARGTRRIFLMSIAAPLPQKRAFAATRFKKQISPDLALGVSLIAARHVSSTLRTGRESNMRSNSVTRDRNFELQVGLRGTLVGCVAPGGDGL